MYLTPHTKKSVIGELLISTSKEKQLQDNTREYFHEVEVEDFENNAKSNNHKEKSLIHSTTLNLITSVYQKMSHIRYLEENICNMYNITDKEPITTIYKLLQIS